MQYRYSGLDTFRQCPTKFKYQYVDRIDPPLDMLWLVNGTMFHQAMQDFYEAGDDKLVAGRRAWADWLESKGVEQPWNVIRDWHEFWTVRRLLLEPFRNGEILNPKGEKYTKPTATNAFKDLKKRTGYDALKRHADSHKVANLYMRERDTLAEAFADCMDWLADYVHPAEYGKSLRSEHKFFITDPWGHTHEGSIDQCFEFEDGYAIHDFKTSKTPKTMVDLDPQLNMYAFAGKQEFGEWPKQVSLHFVRYGLVVKARIEEGRVMAVYDEWVYPLVRSAEWAMQTGVYLKHKPDSFGSPCGMCQYFISGVCNAEYKEATDEVQGEGGGRQENDGPW